MILVDTNVLLRLSSYKSPEYPLLEAAVSALSTRRIPLCYTPQNIIELWNTFTRPLEKNGLGLTPEAANREASVVESRMHLLPERPEVYQHWRRLVVRYGVSGRQVHDARLVAVMLANGVSRLLTLNDTDFKRYADIITIMHPRSVEDYLRASESE